VTASRVLGWQGSEALSSDDGSSFSDSDAESRSDVQSSSDDDGYLSEDKFGLSARMNIPWEAVDEQRLLSYKKEGKSIIMTPVPLVLSLVC
jgi:hypothetical protein